MNVYSINGERMVECGGQARMSDGRCDRCTALVESSGGWCSRWFREPAPQPIPQLPPGNYRVVEGELFQVIEGLPPHMETR